MKRPKLPYWWRGALIPLVFSIVPLFVLLDHSKATRCGLIIIIMAIFWITEALPLPVTALIPIFAFPIAGVLSSSAVSKVYLKDSSMMFLGGLMMAAAVEHSNVHERVALKVILWVGQSPRLLSLGFIMVTSFLSMWISNTSTAAMLVPIVDAVVKELTKLRKLEVVTDTQGEDTSRDPSRIVRNRYLHPSPDGYTYTDSKVLKDEQEESYELSDLRGATAEGKEGSAEGREGTSEVRERGTERREPAAEESQLEGSRAIKEEMDRVEKECESLKKMLFLSVAFAANIGGTGSPLGCGPNIILLGLLDSAYEDSLGLNFATWMVYNVPGVILCGLLGWLWLQALYMYCGETRVQASSPSREAALRSLLMQHYRSLGSLTWRECVVGCSFVVLVLLWVFRDPGFITGWGSMFSCHIHAATPVMVVIFGLFCMPAHFRTGKDVQAERCMTWDAMHRRVQWGIILLMGGGLALAEGTKKSGLSHVIGEALEFVGELPQGAVLVVVCVLTALLTEFVSNTATASVLLPILLSLSHAIQVSPLLLLIPATACCAYAFMLPIATPGNAIVLTASGMKTQEMMIAGVVMNLLCILVSLVLINSLGYAIFDLHSIPKLINGTAV